MVIPGRMPGLNDYVRAERANRYMASSMKKQQTERAGIAAASIVALVVLYRRKRQVK